MNLFSIKKNKKNQILSGADMAANVAWAKRAAYERVAWGMLMCAQMCARASVIREIKHHF